MHRYSPVLYPLTHTHLVPGTYAAQNQHPTLGAPPRRAQASLQSVPSTHTRLCERLGRDTCDEQVKRSGDCGSGALGLEGREDSRGHPQRFSNSARGLRRARRRGAGGAFLAAAPGSASTRRLGPDGPQRPAVRSRPLLAPGSAIPGGRTRGACGHVAAARVAKYAAPAILCEKPQRRLPARAPPPPPRLPAPRASAAPLISVSRRCSLLTR